MLSASGSGTAVRGGSVRGGYSSIHLPPPGVHRFCDSLAIPWGFGAAGALPTDRLQAFAIPRSRLVDPKRKQLNGSETLTQPLSGTYHGGGARATVSGTYTNHFAITLKRLKLKR